MPPLRLSSRLPFEQPENRLTQALAERSERGLPTIDLTETNPTRVGIAYPEAELAEALRRGAGSSYAPHPRGLPEAREALAAALSRPGDPVHPDDLVLTASTSESYSHLFKVFGDPGDEVLTAAPSYPLLDSLGALEGLGLHHFYFPPERRLDPETVELALTPRTRLVAVVHPGNPTGRYLTAQEQEGLAALCASRSLPLLSDEVFHDFPLRDDPARAGTLATRAEGLAFSLGGLSKSAGLPSFKLGWMRVGGPADLKRQALAALDLVADSYLSVSSPVQKALPDLLALAPRIRAEITGRVRGNLEILRSSLTGLESLELLEPEGGWAAVLRILRPESDEDVAIRLLEEHGVLVHPGYFFDFATDDFLVLSLLPEPRRFVEGVRRLAIFAG